MPKIVGGSHDLGHAHFQGNYLCAHSAFPMQKPPTKFEVSIQVVFEILCSKHIGVNSLTFQGHVTSSVTWPFDSPYFRDIRPVFILHSSTFLSFYLSVELGFIVCFLHFMHICHARHYSTLRNVHYRKRRRRGRAGKGRRARKGRKGKGKAAFRQI